MLKIISTDLDELMAVMTQKDCTELKKLIMENPEAPLLIFVGEEANSGQCGGYENVDAGYVSIEELTVYDEQWLTRDNYKGVKE